MNAIFKIRGKSLVKVIKQVFKPVVFIFCVLFSLGMGYGSFGGAWWRFIPSTILIIAFTRLFYPKQWREYLGLRDTVQSVSIALLICVTLTFLFHAVTAFSLPESYQHMLGDFADYAVVPFQSLNEEFIFRALFLSALLSIKLSRWKAILLPALLFSTFHYLFYAYNVVVESRGLLDYSALWSLFFFGMTMNVLFISTRSILLPWAVHCAWNFNQFGSHIMAVSAPESRVPEYLSFNLLEGSSEVLILSFLAFVIVSYAVKDKIDSRKRSL
ncbi:MAG: membrane protease YdiL (CAAX protease family) [Chlamydiales bacterium]|jgi:membrane protease YdiL (CAAX protease family)